ncbi:MAG TPA: helix-turn-helix domain-containing protein, partial [Blastocatellia bacterium]|nr:helix-turn-helix domain-containing protein [Blastocatellia bacterium]
MNEDHEKVQLLTRIGARVRALRLETGLTVKGFAERAVLSPRFVNQLEAGDANISIAGLARAAAALGCSVREMIPPAGDDHSLSAELWRLQSEWTDDELNELRQWLEARPGRSKPRFVAL